MTAWLSIIGVGDDGLDPLTEAAKATLANASLIVGGERHLAMLPEGDTRPKMTWTNPLMKLVEDILERRGENIVILATGDPMHYGIGVTFAKRLPADELAVYPALSAFTLAATRLKWDLSRTVCVTLHGRPLELLLPCLRQGSQILALSDTGATPAQVANLLCENGFGKSWITVLEHMGGDQENQISRAAESWQNLQCKDLNTLAIDCHTEDPADILPATPGLPDDAFLHDGQLTKKEIRSATLSALAPKGGGLLWDIGAGSGSVGIEWMRLTPSNQAIAVEHHPKRQEFIRQNCLKLGVPGLKLISGKAPDILDELPSPDAIFIGGGLTTDGVFETCWQALKSGGVLVANTVTVEGERKAMALFDDYNGSLTRLDFARAEKTGSFTTWKPFRQITQLRLVKK